jgi:transcriptional regulator with XRE-family HTH domain
MALMADELLRAVGDNVRIHREAIGISQEALAASWGLHRTYIGSLERGERNLTLRSVERLAKRLRIEPIDLLTAPSTD